jgi:hypothetical protein
MEIIFAGGSHYEVEGFQSICKKFDKVYVINKDAEAILPWMRRDDVLILWKWSVTMCFYVDIAALLHLQN